MATDYEQSKAMDLASTILSYREDGLTFQTIKSMRDFIKQEQKVNKLDAVVCVLTEQFVKDAGEWHDQRTD